MKTLPLPLPGKSCFLKVLMALQSMQPADDQVQLSIVIVTEIYFLSNIKSEFSLEQFLIMTSSTTFMKPNHDRILQS